MKFKQVLEEKDKGPKVHIEKGDMILLGKWKNKKAEVEGFGKDDNNQPTVKTDKGEKPLYKFRINKFMPKDKRK